jgi:prolipoprotein diacylglyceryltransferase
VCYLIIDTQQLTKEYNYKFVAVTSQTIQTEVLEENTVSEVLPRTLLLSEEFYCCLHKTHVHLTHLYCLCLQTLASAMVAYTCAHTHACMCVCVFVIFCTFRFFVIELLRQNSLADACGCSASLEFPYFLCNHDILLPYSQKLMN